MNRIQAALGRIEAASAHLGHAIQPNVATSELKARHDTLRSQTAAALADLNALIEHSDRDAAR